MIKLEEIFETKKPIIGVVHLKPLPGSPSYGGEFEYVITQAVEDAKKLEMGGVHGIIVENFGDAPYELEVSDPENFVAMTLSVKSIVDEVSVPVGVNYLRNNAVEAAAIAHLTGCKFIRVNVFVETVATDSGVIEPVAPKLLRYIKKIGAKLGILADIQVKHGKVIGERDLVSTAKDALERGKASAIIITGKRTGEPPSLESLKMLRERGIKPILIGSGLKPENIELLKYADGAIVGTYFKKGGVTENPVDINRVKKLIDLYKEYL